MAIEWNSAIESAAVSIGKKVACCNLLESCRCVISVGRSRELEYEGNRTVS